MIVKKNGDCKLPKRQRDIKQEQEQKAPINIQTTLFPSEKWQCGDWKAVVSE
jgi:hypothetical protein